MAEIGNVTFKVEAITAGFDKLVGELTKLNSSIQKTNQLMERQVRQNKAVIAANEQTSRSVTTLANAQRKGTLATNTASAASTRNAASAMNMSAAQTRAAVASNLAAVRMNRLSRQTVQTGKSVKVAGVEIKNFTERMTDLSKSIQIALGPLSGVAARITAFASLANRTVVTVAGLISAFIAFGAVMLKSIKTGALFEQKLMSIRAVLAATGRQSEVTAEQIDAFATEFGIATLSTRRAGIEASNSMLQFRKVGTEIRNSAVFAAQGLTLIGRGGLATQIRRIGRVLNDPIKNIDALREAGIEFNSVEKRMITNLQLSGDLLGAQKFIVERLKGAIAAAKGETGGLSGAIDTLNENITTWFDRTGRLSGATQVLTKIINSFDKELDMMAKNLETSERFGNTIIAIVEAIGNAILFVVRNIDILVKALIVLAALKTASLLRTLIRSMGLWVLTLIRTTRQIRAATSAQRVFNLVMTRFPIVFIATALLTMLELLGVFEKIEDKIANFGINRVDAEIKKTKAEIANLQAQMKKFRDAEMSGKTSLFTSGEAFETSQKLQTAQKNLIALEKRRKEVIEETAKQEGKTASNIIALPPKLRAMADEADKVAEQFFKINIEVEQSQSKVTNLQKILGLLKTDPKAFEQVSKALGLTKADIERLIVLQQKYGTQADKTIESLNEQSIVLQNQARASLATIDERERIERIEEIIVKAREASLNITRAQIFAQGTLTKLEKEKLNAIILGVINRRKDEKAAFAADRVRSIREEIEMINKEQSLLLVSAERRRDLLELLELEQELRRRNIDLESKEGKLIIAAQKALQNRRQQLEDLKTFTDILADGFAKAGDALATALLEGGDAGEALKGVLREVVAELIKAAIKALFLRDILNSIGGSPTGGGLNIGGLLSGFFGFLGGGTGGPALETADFFGAFNPANPGFLAKGGVLSGGNIVRFASGGVVGGPTTFGLTGGRTGLMGEAGPEAVMPLVRGPGGSLGVSAKGAGGGQTIYIDARGSNGDAAVEAAVQRGIKKAAPSLIQASVKRVTGENARDPKFIRNV